MVAEGALPGGVRRRAYRDGMLMFDFGSWGEPPPVQSDDFDLEAAYRVRCVRLMNTHLACLNAVARRMQSPTVVAPDHLLRMDFETGAFVSAGGEGSDFELWKARMGEFHRADDRIMRSGVVSVIELQRAAELLTRLLNLPDQGLALLRAELILRSAASYADHDHNTALVFAWTVAESCLGELLTKYLDDVQDRPIEGPGKFISASRRDFFNKSQMTARHTVEVLSLADRLPFDLYKSVRNALKARNDWLHKRVEATGGDAVGAVLAAQKLFALVGGPSLEMPLGRQLQ